MKNIDTQSTRKFTYIIAPPLPLPGLKLTTLTYKFISYTLISATKCKRPFDLTVGIFPGEWRYIKRIQTNSKVLDVSLIVTCATFFL